MTAAASTWGDIEDFVKADGWTETKHGKSHVFFEKTLAGGRVLQTHISHSRQKSMSAGRFSGILNLQLEVSKHEFWTAIQTTTPVARPVPLDPETAVQHEGCVVHHLTEGGITADQLAVLSEDEAKHLVADLWSTAKDASDVRSEVKALVDAAGAG